MLVIGTLSTQLEVISLGPPEHSPLASIAAVFFILSGFAADEPGQEAN